MSKYGPPIFKFSRLKPATMTVISPIDVNELNLPAIFAFLPVTSQELPQGMNFQRKQGKIRLPSELNVPGEILSMRYDKQVRGIVRSKSAYSFSHSIIIDVGTSERIVSVKLSCTIEITGATSFKIAGEAANAVLGHVRRCQEEIVFIRNNKALASEIKGKLLEKQDLSDMTDDKSKRMSSILRKMTRGYPEDNLESFMDFIIDFDRNLYTGNLKLGKLYCEMANILFNLGFPINQLEFARVMNNPPFKCKYNNIKNSSAVNVYYYYTKYDRNTGSPKLSKHTIRVNKSGHVRHSGPSLIKMKMVYYAFMKRVLENCERIISSERDRQQLRMQGVSGEITQEEYDKIQSEHDETRRLLLNNKIPIATGDDLIENPKKITPDKKTVKLTINTDHKESYTTVSDINTSIQMPELQFDYKPLSQRK